MARPKREVPWLDKAEGGNWYAFWYDAVLKRTRRQTLGTKDPVEAQARFAEFLANKDAFDTPNPSLGLSVHQALDNYWREHVATGVVVDRTRIDIATRRLKEFFNETAKLSDVDIPTCRQYADHRRRELISNSTIRRELGVLKTVAAHNSKMRRIGPTSNPPTPMPSIELTKASPSKIEWLTHDELRQALMLAPNQDLHDFIMLAYYTAARRTSIEQLTPAQINLDQSEIDLTHPNETQAQRDSKKRRPVVYIDDAIRPILERLLKENGHTGLLFGRKVVFYEPFRRLIEGMGLPDKAFPHVLRHSRASHLLQDGVDLFDVAKLLGDTIRTTERVYGHHCPKFTGNRIQERARKLDNVVVLDLPPRKRRVAKLVDMTQMLSDSEDNKAKILN